MWKVLVLTGACCLVSATAGAQTSGRSSAGRSNPTVAPPADEEGTTTLQLSNGFIRYRTDDVDEDSSDGDQVSEADEGTFTVMPKTEEAAVPEGRGVKPAPVAAAPTTAAPPVPSPAESMSARSPVIQVPQVETPSCLHERELLAQRLLQTRGMFLDPQTALITLPQIEVPFSPILTRSFFGAPTPYIGGSILASVITWDTETQMLTQNLAKCLMH